MREDDRNPPGYWNFAGRVILHLREPWRRGLRNAPVMKWREICEIFGASNGTLSNASYKYRARERVPVPRSNIRWHEIRITEG